MNKKELEVLFETVRNKKEAKKLNMFKIELGMWVEVTVNKIWVVGQIIDISADGRRVWIETHEDIYKVDRVAESERIIPLVKFED
jgi:hypothetical protein